MKTGDTVVASAYTVERLPHLARFVFKIVALQGNDKVIAQVVTHPNCTLAGTGWQTEGFRNHRTHYNPPMRIRKNKVAGSVYTFEKRAVEAVS